ncbi:hypothetical protein [Hymenobacter rubripertinctus]|uniref:Uncharacterized protein n=1 Tax=Hymenobacter rubripertinctus TaxID=2029981 RepID=A0A418R0Y7_9BACT|nr:hypothetical protein [Hymenobacter rubripertinctus]RIY11028.1 hypothetical protein D0T11_08445 [Hymenobacter rubripertinctus]
MNQTSSISRLAATGLLTVGLFAISAHSTVALGSYSQATVPSEAPTSSWLSLLSLGTFQTHNAYPGPMTDYIIGPVQAAVITLGGTQQPTIPSNYRSTDFTDFDHGPDAR